MDYSYWIGGIKINSANFHRIIKTGATLTDPKTKVALKKSPMQATELGGTTVLIANHSCFPKRGQKFVVFPHFFASRD